MTRLAKRVSEDHYRNETIKSILETRVGIPKLCEREKHYHVENGHRFQRQYSGLSPVKKNIPYCHICLRW